MSGQKRSVGYVVFMLLMGLLALCGAALLIYGSMTNPQPQPFRFPQLPWAPAIARWIPHG